MTLVLTDEIKGFVNGALAAGNPMVLAAVGPDQQPRLSYRGSIQTYSDNQLGLWVRKVQGATIEAIKANPHVALMYRSATTPFLQFHGRARIASDETERARVFESAPERERKSDPERKGVAIIVDLDLVEGVLGISDGKPVLLKMAR